jgi:hypothetical protein
LEPQDDDAFSAASHEPGYAMHGHLDLITLFDQRNRDDQRVARDSGDSQGAVAEQAARTRHP